MSEPHDRETVTRGASLTPERFARVRAIFEAALERPVTDRRGYVDGACGGDRDLLNEVEAMLAAEGRVDPLLDRTPSSLPSSAPEEGRFLVGTVLAGRYRILGLLGKGGMGEVYKGFDLILNQTVALKFLSPANISEPALVRFRNEARIARQVSHPNVCRVYDLGMVEGLHFLSMEYIDGEDLASLLRRIGRLPQDKAIEFTRKICAGLGAAHERGVLHRDLKPANVMIDGRGQVRITDFGLAGLATEIPLSDLRSGTPAYMSPEQKAGKEVTTRSDIYSLGLVLHEMFTGKTRRDTPSSPSDIVKDLDPVTERLILRCLEEDPKRRPASALGVAMALPGADPIAAALAAGETPSPEMVAASQEKEGFSPLVAITCVLGVVLAAIVSVQTGTRIVSGRARMDTPPEALAFQAQEMLKQFGYVEKPHKTAYGFDYWDIPALRYLEQRGEKERDAGLATHRPAVIGFWYRQHQDEFWVDSFQDGTFLNDVISFASPPNDEPGMIRMVLDPTGRLLHLESKPSHSSAASPDRTPDWSALFRAAGLDAARFSPTEPEVTPPDAFDTRMAWTGTFGEGRPERVRVEAASWQGRPVFADIGGDWRKVDAPDPNANDGSVRLIPVVVLLGVLIGSAIVARNNIRAGRGDRRGALKLGSAGFICAIGAWMFTAAHVPSYWELHLVIKALSWAGFLGGLFWTLYMATEPFVRRHWPDALISWNRLTAGRIRDPLVASHILAGTVIGRAVMVWPSFLPSGSVGGQGQLATTVVKTLDSVPAFLGHIFNLTGYGLFLASVLMLLLVLLRPLVRRMWIADVIASILIVAAVVGGAGWRSPMLAINALVIYVALTVNRRLGLLAILAGGVMLWIPLGIQAPSLQSWYGGRSLVILLIPVLVAVWALWVVVSAQRKPSTESAA